MSNPFNQINPNNPMNANNMASIKNMYQALTQSSNPIQLFQNLAQQNPQLQPIVNMLKGGANPQQIFMNMCRQRGIDPQQFINAITNKNAY